MAPQRQERRKRRTRAAIQQAALELFAADGFRATTINAIAEAADVAPRTVTLHFPSKEDLLFASDPFALQSLSARLQHRAAGEDTLDAVRAWMVETMTGLQGDAPEADKEVWRRRALRAQVIAAEDTLRARARAGYYDYELLIAAGVADDLGEAPDALVPRLAATAVVAGLRELYETPEAGTPDDPASIHELIALVDRVLGFARAGLTTAHRV